MKWLPSISFSNSAGGSSSSSSRSSPTRSPGEESSVRRAWRFGSRAKFTRHRKNNHYRDREVSPSRQIPKWSGSHFRSSSGYEKLPGKSASTLATPQPLPLPELSLRRKDYDADQPLPSPRNASASPPIQSILRTGEKRTSGGTTPEKMISRVNHNNFDNFRLEVPVRSAPASPFDQSPALSPKRPSFDIVPYYLYMASKGNQVWSAPEMHSNSSDIDCSPSGSPPGRSIRQLCNNGSSSPLFLPARLSTESGASLRWDCSPIEGHRLPLPPGASSPAVVPMKSQWQKGKLIGRGTFGSVYVASNRETGALCAMKEVELFPDDPKSAECIKQLQQEIKVLSQLKHQNIVQYYGSEIIEDRFYIYLEYVHPGSINKYVRDHFGAITESVVRNFTRHILSGLAYLHSTKTIHRDIKGANLLVDSSGVVKLADFGMAKHLTGPAADLSLKGSPYWMAPELMQAVMQKDNNSDLALAVDIWSLGCTIIEMFTGKPPWSDYEGAAAMFKVLKDTPPIPETLSTEGKDFLRCCFQRNPAERPTASVLLSHRFLRNSQQLDVPVKTFSALNLVESKPNSPTRVQAEKLLEQFPKSQRGFGGKLSLESEIGRRSCSENNLKSPRSTLEVVPGLSPPTQ